MWDVVAALLPMLVAGAAFVAVGVAVMRATDWRRDPGDGSDRASRTDGTRGTSGSSGSSGAGPPGGQPG